MSSNATSRLSFTRFQEELWLAHQALPEKHPGLASCGRFDLDGNPDPVLVLRALTQVVQHFPILTSTLSDTDESTPVLKSGAYPEPDFQVIDLLDVDDQEVQAQRFLDNFREEAFTPIGGRLCHFALIRFSDTRSCFLSRVFHLVGDGVAAVNQFSLMAEIYTALQAQQTLELGPACLWDEEVEADRAYQNSARAPKDVEFWTEYLKQLPTERIFTSRCGYPDRIDATGQFSQMLSLSATECLHTLAAEYGGFSTLFLVLHSIVLSRLYDANKLVVQVPFLLGERKDKRRIHGNRVGVSPLIVALEPADNFRTIIKQVQKNTIALLRHAKTPFQAGLRKLEDWRSFEHLWDTNINYLPAPPEGGLGDIKVRAYTPIPSRYEPMLLGVYLMENLPGQGIQLTLVYSHNHFTLTDIQNYIARFEQLLFAVQRDPDLAVGNIDLLLETEHQALVQWQQGEILPFFTGTIPGLFDQVANRYPERIAIKGIDGKACSYSQLQKRSDSVAGWFLGCGVKPGEVVAVMARRHPDLPETILGIMKAGAVYLPLDPDYPEERIRHMLEDSGAQLVIALAGEKSADFGLSLETRQIPSCLPEILLPDVVAPDAAAYLIYTSGSTGKPKGVLVPHRGFVNMSQGMITRFGIGIEDRVLQFASPSFDASLAEIFMPLLAGACLHPVPRSLLDEPWALKEYMTEQQISAVTFPPSYLSVFRRESFPNLRVLVTAGEAPIAEDARHYAAELAYFNAYGPTEASVCATLTRVTTEPDSPYISIGKPLPNTRTYILDHLGRQVVPGIPGELCLGGIGLALGYLNRPDLNREKFVTLPFAPGERIYRTGDRAVWTEQGDIVLLGRIDDQVKIRGHRIEPGEITELLEQHPAVVQACVLAVAGSSSGYELCAFLLPGDAAAIDISAVQAWLRMRLPDYMVPARFHLVAAMPLAPTGKIDKRALLCRIQETESASGAGPAGSDLEEAVRDLYAQVLGQGVASLDTDFFAMGGDSLKAIQLVRLLSQTFICKMSVRDFWADTSVSAVAKAIAVDNQHSSQHTEHIDALSLSQGQLQLWNQECITGPSPRYNMPFAFEIEADTQEIEDFSAALLQAIECQPACRCQIAGEIDAPYMKLLKSSGLQIERIDLCNTLDRQQQMQQILEERTNSPFDLNQAPLLRATLLKLDSTHWTFLLVMHHIIGDAESMHILLQSAVQRMEGKALESTSPVALQRFVEAERAYLAAPALQADLAFWRTQLSPLPARVNFVSGHPRPAVKKGVGNLLYHALPSSSMAGLQQLAEQAGTSVLGGFIGVLMHFLRLRLQEQDITIAVPVGLRDEAELFNSVGYFVNTVLVRSVESANADLPDAIRKTGQSLRQALQHSRVPFGILPAALGERRDPSRAPLVDLVATHIDESATLPAFSSGLKFKLMDVCLHAAKFDATFSLITRSSGEGQLALEYDTGIIPAETAGKLLLDLVSYIAQCVVESAKKRAVNVPNPNVAVLAQVWQEILGGDVPQPESNFFLCGGDSIKAIQMIGLLRRKGVVSLSPAQLFEYPTLGELCAKLEEAGQQAPLSRYPVPQSEVAIALLPIQHDLFRNHPQHWRAFHMALPMRLDAQVDIERLKQALHELPLRHEALRLVFTSGAMRLRQHPPALIWDEFTAPAALPTGEVFTQAAHRLFSRIDPEQGISLGLVLARHGSERLLLLGGHHLVLDAVSLDILRRELAWFCQYGTWPSPEGGSGIATWAAQLAKRTGDFPDAEEIRSWEACCATPAGALRTFKPAGPDRIALRVALRRSISGAGQYLHTNPRSSLLAALGQALHTAGQTDAVFVLLEGHGREAIVPGLDISQAVGWFTSTFPLALTPSADLAGSAARLDRRFEQLAHNGIGYGLAALRHPESLAYRPQIALNYLGRLLSSDENNGFEPLPQWSSPDALPGLFHPDYQSDTPLDLLAYFSSPDELCLVAHFSPQCLDEQWIATLLDAWQAALKRLSAADEDWVQLASASQCSVDEIQTIGTPDPAQESMLFQHLLDAEKVPGLTYVQQINFRLNGEMDDAALATSWTQVVNRHESLRSLFPVAANGEFRRLVLKQARTTLERYDLSALPAAMQAAKRAALLQERLHAPFDLACGPLLQMQLLRFAPDHHEMSWCFHHLLMDGWCVGILLRELFSGYVSLSAGITPHLPPAPSLQAYRQWRRGYNEVAAHAYWRHLLQDFSRMTPLSPESAHADQAETLQDAELFLDEVTARNLQQVAAEMSATLPNLLQALWGILLSAHGNAGRDMVYGLVSSGRPAEVAGIDSMVGLFIHTLPVRIHWNENDTLAALVGRVREQAIERAAHEFLPLAEIQQVSAVTGPLFDHILVFENYPLDGIVQEGAPKIGAVSGFEQHPYALGLSIIPGERLLFRFSFKPSVFTGQQIQQLRTRWQKLLDAVAGRTRSSCQELECLLLPDTVVVPASFNLTARPYPRERSVCSVLREVAAAHPNSKAFIGPDGNHWSYRELDRVSDQIAAGLGALNAGEPVAMAMARGPEAVAVMLGILKAGGCYLPLDEKNPQARIGNMLRIAGCHRLIYWRDGLSRLDPQDRPSLACYDYAALTSGIDKPVSFVDPEAGQAAYVMFTSGSTGEPKGVVVPHRAILRLVCNSDFWDIAPNERVLQAGPLGFDASTLEIWGALLNGATVCFIHDDDLLSPKGLRRKIATDRITQMWLTSSLCNLLADEDPGTFAALRRLFTGGEALSPVHIRKIVAACPDLEIFNGYGPTENTTFTTVHQISADDLAGGPIPIGKPIANTRVHVVNEHGTLAAIGEWGEICAAGDGLALGYIGRDDLTRKAFVDLPAPVGERVYRTGDIGRWRDDGVIEFLGRRDGQVKIRGYRIELSEIEAAISHLPNVRQVAVIAPGSGENRSLVAFVQTENQGAEVLKQALKPVLPAYMVPDRIECLAALPMTSSGKLDRVALERLALARCAPMPNSQTSTQENKSDSALVQQKPVESGEALPRSLVSPGRNNSGNDLEQRVAAIFGEVLGIEVTSFEADFFELGGQSLKAMRLRSRINHQLGIDLSLHDVMSHSRVDALARRIRETGSIAKSGPQPVGEQADYPFSSGQERLWFLQHLQPDSTAYHVPYAARLRGDVDRNALQQALTLLEARHDALRLRMPANIGEGELRQQIAKAGGLILDYRDFSADADPCAAVAAAVGQAMAHPFHFGFDEPLLRASLLRESADSCVLLLDMHHIIFDGWSSEIFLRELQQAYRSALRQTSPDWPALPLRYVDYACWQREFLAGPDSAAAKARWSARMTPLPESLKLPTDKPRPALPSQQGDVLRFKLDARQNDGLKACAHHCGLTLFPVLVALVKTFLYRHTGQTDLVVGVPVAGRDHENLQGLIGFFVNTLPLRDRLQIDAGFYPLVQNVGAAMREALDDQCYPLEMLVSDLNVPREASRNPLFDVLVSLDDPDWRVAETADALPMRQYDLPHRQSKMDLSFYFHEEAGLLVVDIEFATDLFEPASIEHMAQRLGVLVDSVLAAPNQPLRDIPLLTAAERELVLGGFNATDNDWLLDGGIDGCFRQSVAANPIALALRASDGSTLSYTELDRRVTALAAGLQAEGVTPGTFVGVCYERSIDLMLAIFAVLRVGAVYVPFVPGLPAARIAAMAEDLQDCVVLAADEHVDKFRALGLRVLTPDPASRMFIRPELASDAAGYVIFTSGSTGRPKGVLVEQRGVLNRLFWMQSCFPLNAQDVILQKTPVSFDVSVWELFWWSWTGASLALLAPDEEKDPAAIVAAIERHGVTVMHFVPSMLRAFLDHLERHPQAIAALHSLHWVFASGEALTTELVARFNRLLHAAHGTELHNLYGPTEATVDVTWQPCSPVLEGACVPIGRPIANTRIYILDAAGQPVPVGVAGELFISGIQVARGYVGRPDLTAERFLPDPFNPPMRMYRSGDLARWRDSGEIEYLGRCDDQVKIRGFRIELGEVEAALERCSGVAQAVVRVGEIGGMPSLEAFLVPAVQDGFTLATLRRELSESLPDYMCPAAFYQIEQIPLNPSGKADRKALQGQRLSLRETGANHVVQEYTPTELLLRQLWAQLFPEAGAIDVEQNFFDLGGNSLLLIRLHENLEVRWPGCFNLADLFVAVSIRQQAAHIDNAVEGAIRALPAVPLARPVQDQAIAVIGMALRLGDYEDADSLWADLLAGCDRTGLMPESRKAELLQMLAAIGIDAEDARLRQAAYLQDISSFDCKRFGMAPSDARLLDPEQRLFLETASRALEDAGYGGRALYGKDVGIFVGASPSQTFKEAVSRSFPEQVEQAFILNVPSSVATRLGYLKNWSGPAELVDTACSSSLKAIRDACQSLVRGECSMALAGGARVVLTPIQGDKSFAIETTTGQTRTFDASADGVGAGEGVVVFLLKPLAQAQADGDAIHAVILGGAINQDGRSASIAAPSPVAQSQVIRAAAADAGVELDSLDFFEAHGTGTALGDPIEIDGLTRAFESKRQNKAWIGSVKGNLGHLDSAAGAIGMAKAILALQHGVVPRQPHFEKPNPRIDFARAPVVVAQENQVLAQDQQPWRCGVSAFGLSGINVHLILQQASPAAWPADNGSWQCLLLSAASEQGLRTYAENMLQVIAAHPHWPLHAIAATLVSGREHLAWRMAIPARTRDEFLGKLMAWCFGGATQATHNVRPDSEIVLLPDNLDEPSARQVAEAFMAGAEPQWPNERKAWRVHLPTVPLERVCCWPKFLPQQLSRRVGWLGEAINSPQGWLFSVPVAADDFWPVAEHRLASHPTLVGMAMIGLLAEAISQLQTQETPLCIENLSWLRPLVAEQVVKNSAALTLQEAPEGFSATLAAREVGGGWADFSTARLRYSNDVPGRIDLAGLRARIDALQPEPATESGGMVQVSVRWACRRKVWQSADGSQTLAMLELPDAYRGDLRTAPWHPALLDVAASLALDRPGLVPACCREVHLYRPLEARMLVHVVRQAAGQGLQADCQLLNEQGEILVGLHGLLFMPLQAARANLHRLEWKAAALPPQESLEAGEILMLGGGALADDLAQVAQHQGRAWRQRALPGDDAACQLLANEIIRDGLNQVVYVLPDTGQAPWLFAALLQAVCRAGLRHPLQFLTVGRGALVGQAGQSPDAALALGVLLSLAQEEPLLAVRYVELEGAVSAEAVLLELNAIPAEAAVPVLLADGKRFLREISAPLLASNSPLPAGCGCVVFTGGLGAMALTLAEAVVPALGDSVALLHRGDFPQESEWETLSHGSDSLQAERAARLLALRSKGVAFRLYSCDVTDRAALVQTLMQVRQDWDSIGGIVHTAGVAGGGFLINKDRATFDAVLAPKVTATRYLHELTLSDALRFFVLAGSRTALSGAPGQTDYAAANAWLDAFAAWRQAQGLPATSIDWNTWGSIGMAARLGAVDTGRANLAPEQAAAVFLQSLVSGASQLIVSMPGENLAPRATPAVATVAAPGKTDLPLSERVMATVAAGLGYETPLSPDDDFYSLGGDSITGMQIVNRLQRELGLPVSLADLFANSRLGDFVEAISRVGQSKAADPGRPLAAPLQADYPVSREQLAVLQAEAVATPHTGYNLPQFLRLPLDFDFQRLESALNQLVERHEILRTCFRDLIDESPRMQVLPAQPFQLTETTIATLDAAAVQHFVRPFALTQAPLFRASVLHVQHGHGAGALFFFDIHHAVADARGVNLLLADLYHLYQGETLPALGLQQKDAAWYQQQQAASLEAAARGYWLERFAGSLPKLDLPADHPRPRSHTNRGATAGFAVPAQWLEPIRALAREQSTTSYVLMLSLWSLLLGRLGGVDDLVIAVAADGRDREEFDATPGMFASLLPLRLKLAETERFSEVLQRNQRVHADAMRHRAFPLNRLLSTLRVPVTLDRTLLAEVMFSYMNFEHAEPAQEGFQLLPVANPACKADLAIFASDIGTHISFALEYYADLFDAARIERMGLDFLDLLRQLVEQGADVPLSALHPVAAPLPGCTSQPEAVREAEANTRSDVPIAMLDMVLAVFRRFFNDAAIEQDDSFFELGGHSLLGLQMANQLAQQTGRELTIRDIFDHPTPLAMALLLASLGMSNHRILPADALPDGRYPLSHAQQRLYVLHHTDGGAVAYNMSFVFRVNGPLDPLRMQHALGQLCERHETLRTAFAEEDGQVWQVVQHGVQPEFNVHRLETDALDEVLSYFRQDAVQAFDLHHAPLLRMRICQLGNDQAFLSLVMHHIVGDGWSMQVFFGELMALYVDAGVNLPQLQIQYRDYALWQQGRDWQAEAAYWKQTLQGAPDRIALPGDANASAKPMAAGVVRRMLPASLLQALRLQARNKGVSLATLMLTLFSALLYRLTRQQDMVIGMGVAGRERAELEGLVGFFINILPIRVRMDDETEIDELLDQVHRASLEALERQDYPFDLLVREVMPARAQRESLVNVMFEYQRYSDLKQIHSQAAQDDRLDFTLVDLDDFEGAPGQIDPGAPGVGPGAKYDLTLFVQDEPAGCRLKAEYDRSLLTEQTVSNWLIYLETFMTALIQSANRKDHENI